MSEIVAYLRVSTESQGKSGLGLEAQREMVRRFAMNEGLEFVGDYIEIEKGRQIEPAADLHPLPRLAPATVQKDRRRGYARRSRGFRTAHDASKRGERMGR